MIRKARTLDNRNLGVHATVEDEGSTFYGIIASVRKFKGKSPGTEDKVVITFTDGTTIVGNPDLDIDMTLSGTALTIQDLESTVDALFNLLTKPKEASK